MMEIGLRETLRGIHFYFDSPISVITFEKVIYNCQGRLISTLGMFCVITIQFVIGQQNHKLISMQ